MTPSRHNGLWLITYLFVSRVLSGFAKLHIRKRLANGKEDSDRYIEKFGISTANRPDTPLVWLHAVGVGEVLALTGLIAEMHSRRPEITFLVTSTALTSARALARNMPPNTIHQFLPLDSAPFIAKFLNHWKPDLSVWAEQDLWPAMIAEVSARGIPLVLINGRISPESYRSKRRARGLFKDTYNRFTEIQVQDATTAAHLLKLGVDAERLLISGSLKSGGTALSDSPLARDKFEAMLSGRKLWLATSTHEGEETILAQAHKRVLDTSPTALLIIAPRDPSRGQAVVDILNEAGITTALQSADDIATNDTQAFVADAIGELGLWYRLSDIVFVGGSLVPVGGHNPYEPARLDCAVMHGPYIENFELDYTDFQAQNAAIQIGDAEEIANAVLTADTEVLKNNAQRLLENAAQPVQDCATDLLTLLAETEGLA